MSEQNVEIVRLGYERMNEAYKTGEFLLRFITAQLEAFSDMWLRPEEFIEVGEQIVVPVRFGGRARHTGIEIEFSAVHVWTLRDGKAVRMEARPD